MSYSFDSFVNDATRFVQALLSTDSTPCLLSCDLSSVSDKDPSFDVIIPLLTLIVPTKRISDLHHPLCH